MSTAGEATEVKPVEGLHLTGVPLDRQPPPCSQERERRVGGGFGGREGVGGGGQAEGIHLPVETLTNRAAAQWQPCARLLSNHCVASDRSEQRRTDPR